MSRIFWFSLAWTALSYRWTQFQYFFAFGRKRELDAMVAGSTAALAILAWLVVLVGLLIVVTGVGWLITKSDITSEIIFESVIFAIIIMMLRSQVSIYFSVRAFSDRCVRLCEKLTSADNTINQCSLDWLEGVKKKKFLERQKTFSSSIQGLQSMLSVYRSFPMDLDVIECIKQRTETASSLVDKMVLDVDRFITWCEQYRVLSNRVDALLTLFYSVLSDEHLSSDFEALRAQSREILNPYLEWERFFIRGDFTADYIMDTFPKTVSIEAIMDMINRINKCFHKSNSHLKQYHESFEVL